MTREKPTTSRPKKTAPQLKPQHANASEEDIPDRMMQSMHLAGPRRAPQEGQPEYDYSRSRASSKESSTLPLQTSSNAQGKHATRDPNGEVEGPKMYGAPEYQYITSDREAFCGTTPNCHVTNELTKMASLDPSADSGYASDDLEEPIHSVSQHRRVERAQQPEADDDSDPDPQGPECIDSDTEFDEESYPKKAKERRFQKSSLADRQANALPSPPVYSEDLQRRISPTDQGFKKAADRVRNANSRNRSRYPPSSPGEVRYSSGYMYVDPDDVRIRSRISRSRAQSSDRQLPENTVKFAYGDDEVTVTQYEEDDDGGRRARADALKRNARTRLSERTPTPVPKDPRSHTIASASKAKGSKSGRTQRA